MKENEFRRIINKIDTDSSMDRRITDKLLSYGITDDEVIDTDKSYPEGSFTAKHGRKRIIRIMPKIAAALVLLAVLGTATAWAAGFLVKSHPIEMEVKSKEETEEMLKNIEVPVFNKKYYRGGRKIADGFNVFGYKIGEENDAGTVKSVLDNCGIYPGEEAFATLKLPDLTPSYLINNYLLGNKGYIYIEWEQDGKVLNQITAAFVDEVNHDEEVYFNYMPSNVPAEKNVFIYDEDMAKDIATSTYVTKGGITFTIQDSSVSSMFTSAMTIYDSETLGSAVYELQFEADMGMDQIKEILDTVPLKEDMNSVTSDK